MPLVQQAVRRHLPKQFFQLDALITANVKGFGNITLGQLARIVFDIGQYVIFRRKWGFRF